MKEKYSKPLGLNLTVMEIFDLMGDMVDEADPDT